MYTYTLYVSRERDLFGASDAECGRLLCERERMQRARRAVQQLPTNNNKKLIEIRYASTQTHAHIRSYISLA